MRRLFPALTCIVLLWSCGCSDDSGGSGGALKFHGELGFLQGFAYDTGMQPSGSPIQVRLELSTAGSITADAIGAAAGDTVTPEPGSGAYQVAGKVKIKTTLKLSLGTKKFEGPIPNAPDIQLEFGGKATFDPFLLGGKKVSLPVKVPMTQLAKIPLAGALSAIPGIKGDVTISASGDLTSEFTGVCVKVQGGVAQYTGQTVTSGTLTIKPVVEVSVPLLGSKKLDSLSVDVPIKGIGATMDLGSFNVSDGTKATAKPCAGAIPDGGVAKDAGPAGDGPASDGPVTSPDGGGGNPDGGGTSPDKGAGHCKGDADCTHLNGTGSKGTCVSGVCVLDCTGFYYDVNGKTSDGCESLDAYGLYSTEAKAWAIKGMTDCDKDKLLSVPMLSDDRYHTMPKGFLPNGTVRYIKIPITDKLCALSAKVKFDLSKLPKLNKYKVETRYVCKNGVSTSYSGATLSGGSSQTVAPKPSIPCPGLDDSGTLYIKAQKSAGGAHSDAAMLMTVTP